MAGWQDRAVETSFKPTEGGYIFQCPNPWLFGRTRSYLVNASQKEALAACLRQRQRVILWLMAVYVLVALGLTSLLQSMSPAPDPSTPGFLAVIALTMMGMFALAMAPHLYLMRKIRPLLPQLQPTEEAITLREQIFGVAAQISNMHLVLGGLGGFLVVAASVKSIVEDLSEGRVGMELYWRAFGLLVGTLLMSYFVYLALLKRRLTRRPK